SDGYGPFIQWYLWCRASGHGDLEAARKSAQGYAAYPQADVGYLICYYAGEGDTADEIGAAKNAAVSQPDPFWELLLATIYDGAQRKADRDQAIRAAISLAGPTDPEENELARMLQDAVTNHQEQLDLNAFSRVFANLTPGRRAPGEYIAAEWLIHHGQGEKGIEFLKRVAVDQNDGSISGWLARFELHDKGIDSFGLAGAGK
ncbi:MAG TPA: hypothetical protein VMD30_00165, partial [Tepidisphaeraceae bacterium]|nr:hypothetical protein [Tepidisphaeraceae bacterium]